MLGESISLSLRGDGSLFSFYTEIENMIMAKQHKIGRTEQKIESVTETTITPILVSNYPFSLSSLPAGAVVTDWKKTADGYSVVYQTQTDAKKVKLPK